MKPNTHMQELFPDLPWAGNRSLLADWDNNCVRDKGWPFVWVKPCGFRQWFVEFIDDENQTWHGTSLSDFPGLISCYLVKHDNPAD